jgi:6-phosphogluconolactonase
MSLTTLVIGTYTEPMGHVPSAHAAAAYLVQHDPDTGHWGSIANVDLGSSPSFLATIRRPGGALAAVAANESSHTLTSSQLLPAPPSPPVSVFLGDRPACCSYPCHVAVHPSQNWVICCAYFGGVASVHPVTDDENGIAIAGDSCSTLRVTSSSGCDPDRQAAPHLHCACFSPCGTAVLLCDLGADCVYVCAFSPSTGSLSLSSSCPIGSGTGPRSAPPPPSSPPAARISCRRTRHLLFHPLRPDTVFVANELDNSISLCHWDAAALLLKVTCSLPLLPLSCKEQVQAVASTSTAHSLPVTLSASALPLPS